MKFRVKIDGEMFEVELGDLDARPILAAVAGQTFEIWPELEAPQTEPSARPVSPSPSISAPPPQPVSPSPSGDSSSLTAPIPGVILTVRVKPGDSVSFGQELCVLEAMKMKNVIRASREGVIAEVCISPGDQVRHGQTLITFAG